MPAIALGTDILNNSAMIGGYYKNKQITLKNKSFFIPFYSCGISNLAPILGS
jgi:hypothetical protein